MPDGFISNKLLSKPIAKDGVIYRALDPGSLSTRGNRFLPTCDNPDHKDARPVKIASMTVAALTPPEPEGSIEEWVRFYRRLGFNVIPAPTESKRPTIQWIEFQKRKATDEEIDCWLHDGSFQNIAVLCGETSDNLTVIDFDEMEAYKQSFDAKIEDETLVVRTGSGRGVHVYLRGDKPVATVSYEHQKPKFSIRGQGAIAILPPSIHPTGQRYEVISRTVEPMEIEQIQESLAKMLSRLGVKDKKPLNITEVVKGVSEGGREVNMFRLAWYLLKMVKLDKPDAWTQLQDRNRLNEPPLSENELKHCFDCAKKAGTPKELDKTEKAEFDDDEDEALQPTPEEYDLAKKILKSPHVLQIVKILLDEGIRRESRNKLYAFLIILTAKHPNPKLKQILVLGGEPGGGKTTIANLLGSLVRTKKVGRFSEHAMDYSNLERYQMLYIQELLDLEQQKKMGVSSVRFLSADDQGYTIEVTKGDPDGGFSTQTKKIPAMTVITTTTVADTEAQFERRIHRINTDESRETTRAVLDWKAKEEKRAVLEWIGEVKPRRGIYILKAIVDLLESYEVSTAPISDTLSKVLKETHLRARGDYNKLLALTQMLAWLHQLQRPYVVRVVDGREERLIFALPQDAYYALQIGLQPLLTMMTGLDQRLRDLLPVIGEFKNSEFLYKAGKEQETIKGFTVDQLLPRAKEAVRKPNLSKRRLYDWLKILDDRGVLAFTKAGRHNVYTLISDIDVQSRLGNAADSESAVSMTADLQKEAEIFLSSIVRNVPETGIGVTPQDWFDNDELDRDLTPLIEQVIDVDTGVKLALRHRRIPASRTWAASTSINRLGRPQRRAPPDGTRALLHLLHGKMAYP